MVRNTIVKAYAELRTHVSVDPPHIHGAAAPTDDRPADILVPPSAHHSAKHLAMDVSVVSPDNVGPLNQGSHTNQYKAAKQTEHRKLREYTSFLATLQPPLTPATSDYEKMPLVMESTGAWGPSMQKWWAKMLKLHNTVEAERALLSRRARGIEHTWSANSFSAWWAQRISCAYMRHLGESIQQACASGPYSHFNG